MDVHATSILEFFSGEKQCVVPLFQRRYSWGRLQWRTLWEDICTCVEHTKNGSSTPHFLGAVVTMKLTGGMTGVSRSQVIDGQQRLTTVSVMLAAMASIADGKDRKRIESYLTNEHEEGDDRLKLLPTSQDQDAYKAVVFSSKELPDHPITAAYDFFYSKFNKNPELIVDWVHVIRERLTVVEIALDGSDDAYLIFESLNHKGQPLTQADLIRNHIMMRFEKVQKSQQQHVYQTHWRPMEQRVREAVKAESQSTKNKKRMSDDMALTEFFRADMMRLKGDKVVRRRVYDEFRQRFSEMSNHEAIRAEVERLDNSSRHVTRFHRPSLERNPACREPLVTLDSLGQTTPHTLMLELYDQQEVRGIEVHHVADALRAIESFIVRRLWVQVPTNQLQRLFYGWAKMMRDAQPEEPGNWLREQMRWY